MHYFLIGYSEALRETSIEDLNVRVPIAKIGNSNVNRSSIELIRYRSGYFEIKKKSIPKCPAAHTTLAIKQKLGIHAVDVFIDSK